MIEIGDVVYLKSGGPGMIVTGIHQQIAPAQVKPFRDIDVQWAVSGGELNTSFFPEYTLTKAKPRRKP